MYGQSSFRRSLTKLDERMMVLSQIDSGIRIGRLQGELHQMQLHAHYRDGCPLPKYERTPEYRLMKHYEREYHRRVKEFSR